ncbi:MAG TPA: 5-(carboxyamino)imidazole ribonucleotide synthase [Burkholderiaceae bacterium]|nr:5-(carboxyamino)imidazole ribonucleotide synthase [Burkholderiaceae bacterium]
MSGTERLNAGTWLGVLGGGQLGRMFAHAAQRLGLRVCVLEPAADSSAGQVADEMIVAAYDDTAALDALAARCRSVTIEFENVPAAALAHLATRVPVAPEAGSVAIAQDRVREKRFFAAHGVPVGPHAVIESAADFGALDTALFPAILKTARFGYDGKGQVGVDDVQATHAAWEQLRRVPCVLEQRLALRQEVSCLVCRTADGASITYPVVENQHRDGILAASIAPARIAPAIAQQARDAATRIAAAMRYVGVLCVEFFVLDDGRLVANEMAPRPHNSGHLTIEACETSQFEQQARILAGLPLGATTQISAAVMLNLLGDLWHVNGAVCEPPWAEVLRVPGAKLHLYGKHDPRRGRKMGHVTVLGAGVDAALERASEVARALGLPAVQ